MVTHYVEDPSEIVTKCGLTSINDEPNAYVSLSLDECTCAQCLSLVICDLSKRVQEISKKNMKGCLTKANNPLYSVKSHTKRLDSDAVSTPVYAIKSPKIRNNGSDL